LCSGQPEVRLREAPIGLASQAPDQAVPLRQLPNYPLVMPERGHIFRKLAESAAAMAGVQLRIEWEVSSIPVILELVAAGMGHAALGEDAIVAIQHRKRLAVTPIVEPGIQFTLCLVTSAQRRSTALRQRTAALLEKLLLEDAPLRLRV
jgi:LysR family nitrogen assimilation transcriptional regulator